MGVIADVIFAVAVVALAPGAVTELQFRVGHIRTTADGAAVGVIRPGSFLRLPEGDCLDGGCVLDPAGELITPAAG
mgnify:CR=1 FL=1